MAENLRNLDEVLRLLDEKAVRTSNGVFVRMDDVRELLTQRQAEKKEAEEAPSPKTFAGAKRMAMQDPAIQKLFERAPQDATAAASGVKGATPVGNEAVKS